MILPESFITPHSKKKNRDSPTGNGGIVSIRFFPEARMISDANWQVSWLVLRNHLLVQLHNGIPVTLLIELTVAGTAQVFNLIPF
jgi:hypothetical protein